MKVKIDRARCMSSGNCVIENATLFELDDEGLATVLLDDVPVKLQEHARQAAIACPSAAISIVEDC